MTPAGPRPGRLFALGTMPSKAAIAIAAAVRRRTLFLRGSRHSLPCLRPQRGRRRRRFNKRMRGSRRLQGRGAATGGRGRSARRFYLRQSAAEGGDLSPCPLEEDGLANDLVDALPGHDPYAPRCEVKGADALLLNSNEIGAAVNEHSADMFLKLVGRGEAVFVVQEVPITMAPITKVEGSPCRLQKLQVTKAVMSLGDTTLNMVQTAARLRDGSKHYDFS